MGPGEQRSELRRLLIERGVTNVDALLDDVAEGGYEAVMGAIRWWSEMPKSGAGSVGTGLLVSKIRDGGMPDYKPPEERTTVGGIPISPKVLKTVRGSLLGVEGVFDRGAAAEHFAGLATRLNLSADALIDAAVGPSWFKTPPHPASVRGFNLNFWEYPDEYGGVRYEMVMGSRKRPDTTCVREPTESFWSWACRFWRWGDDEEAEVIRVAERLAKRRAEEAKRRAEEREERLRAAEAAAMADKAMTAAQQQPETEEWW